MKVGLGAAKPASYSLATLFVAIAFVLALILEPVFETGVAFLFLAAIGMSAWTGGLKPGLFSGLLSLPPFAFVTPPVFSFRVEARQLPYFGAFVLSAAALVWLTSDRRRTEAVLEQQASLVDLARDSILVRALDGKIFFWNRGAEATYGWTREEAVGRFSHDLLQTRFPGSLAELESQLLRDGRWEGELDHARRDGSRVMVASRWVLQLDEEGRPWRTLEINNDITARKQAEEQAERSHNELELHVAARTAELVEANTILHSVLESISSGVIGVNEKGKFTVWNASARRILGENPGALHLQHWPRAFAFFHPDRQTPFAPEELPLARALGGESCDDVEVYLWPDRTVEGRWLNVTGRPLRDAAGRSHGGVIAFRDITERKRTEEEIRSLNESLERRVLERTTELTAANQEMEAFAYSVAHDLRAPARHIHGFAEVLKRTIDARLDESERRLLQKVTDAASQMGTLIDDLLEFSRLGRVELRRSWVSLHNLAQSVQQELTADANGRDVKWTIGDLPEVFCDAGVMRQVLMNLMSNALKYTRLRPAANIAVGSGPSKAKEVIFYVEDNGVGFDMEYADKLFRVFQRLHRAQEFEGTGIGLAHVRRIVERHGGRVWAEGSPGVGARFYFSLPAEPNGEPEKNTEQRSNHG